MPWFGSRGVNSSIARWTPSTGSCARQCWLSARSIADREPRDVFRARSRRRDRDRGVSHASSGDPEPSPEDVDLTRRLAAAGVLMGIDVVDHVVLGDLRYCSFKETGRL